MKNTLPSGLLALGLLVCTAGIANAQNTTTAQQSESSSAFAQNDHNAETTADQTSPGVRILTGCLQAGPAANEYTLYGEFPNSWEVRSDSISLPPYVSEIVRIAVLNDATDGVLTATELSLVNTSCDASR